ncbi:MAG: DsbA family protein [Myxococcota bacterium]
MGIDFYFDVVCPFAWLASRAVAGWATPVRYHPILLGGLLREHGADPDPNAAMPASKVALTRRDLARRAAWDEGRSAAPPVAFPDGHPRRTVGAMRLLTAAPPDRVPALAAALFDAYWVTHRDVADPAVLAELARAHGVDPAGIDAQETKDALRARTAAAAARGVFGVPSFVVGGEVHWGVDRLPFVRAAAGIPEPPPPAHPGRTGGEVEFFHDVASPFSYLASTAIAGVAARAGAAVRSTPILVGAVFRDITTPMVPLLTFSPAKTAWVRAELERWARVRGVPLRFPSTFPIRSLVAQRVLVAEPAAAPALYRAAWVDDRPVSDAPAVRRVLDDAGFDGAALVARADDPQVKDQLKHDTERAIRAGVCGVPSFQVGGELFWGQDRLDQVEWALRGWGVATGGTAM